MSDDSTQLPWAVGSRGEDRGIPHVNIKCSRGFHIAKVSSRSDYLQNAEKIVCAVNSHDALLQACKDAVAWHRGDKWRNSKSKAERQAWQMHKDRLEAAILQVEAEINV